MIRRAAYSSILFLALTTFAQTQPAPTPPPDFEADYQKVLHIMKSPPATGVLIADVTRDGNADKNKLQPGDIIISYAGDHADNLHVLRQSLADALAAQALDPKLPLKVDVKIVRDGVPLTFAVDRGGLEITPLDVRSGVPAPLNPPPTARDQLNLAWDSLMPMAKADGPVQPSRRQYIVFRAADGSVTGFMQTTLSRDGTALESDMKVFTRDDLESPTLHIAARFAPSDGKDLPIFLLDTLSYDNPLSHFKVQRQGTRLVERGRRDDTRPDVTPTLMGVIPLECGIESLAAAMPQETDKVLNFAGLDPYSLQTRLGYSLLALGQKKISIDKHEQPLWGVQEMRFGQVEMTWWFDDQRRLILIESPDLRAEAVPTEDAAKALFKPPAPPASRTN